MESVPRVDFGADRYVPFIRTIAIIGFDLTGASFASQIRDRRDGGTLRADLLTVGSASAEGVRLIYAGTDTVANHITAGRLTQAQADSQGWAGTDSKTMSQIGIRINESTMESLPFGDPPGENEKLYWDLQITPPGGTKDVYASGDFVVRAGVTA